MEPTAVTWVVLGLIAQKPCSGYDIKRNVDRSIRQIYPELKRLEGAGWIVGDQAPRGGRARSVYRITGTGSDALRAWFGGRETRIELRDESLLRLFFADTLPLDKALGQLAARREGYRQMLDYLESLDDGTGLDTPFVDLVYRWGLDYCRWGIEWCDRQQRLLSKAA
jgi:DNA-binding PadR family transcriptional regulator